MAVEEIARAHYRSQVSLARRVAVALGGLWARVDRDRISQSWTELIGRASAATAAGQLAAAGSADAYVAGVLAVQGINPTGSAVDPAAFAGIAADGRALDSLLYQPAITALTRIRLGRTVDEAMTAGQVELDLIVRTEIADAGRVADGVAITARPQVTGYVRMLVLPSCSRCILLAGQTYRWNGGFARHDRCDCRHIPASENVAGDLRTDPKATFDAMSEAEQDRIFTRAGARAIRDGADIGQVVNVRRRGAVYVAGDRLLTREGATRRGFAGKRLGARSGGRSVRLMPEQIYRETGDDRQQALRLLRQHGYLI